ncbi:hypothetical protein ABW19_dt0202563 [Dactylella cylindrospora]|nr:hypothetical protein ABW19_dt0202563 [Dactylella cylindrospora]
MAQISIAGAVTVSLESCEIYCSEHAAGALHGMNRDITNFQELCDLQTFGGLFFDCLNRKKDCKLEKSRYDGKLANICLFGAATYFHNQKTCSASTVTISYTATATVTRVLTSGLPSKSTSLLSQSSMSTASHTFTTFTSASPTSTSTSTSTTHTPTSANFTPTAFPSDIQAHPSSANAVMAPLSIGISVAVGLAILTVGGIWLYKRRRQNSKTTSDANIFCPDFPPQEPGPEEHIQQSPSRELVRVPAVKGNSALALMPRERIQGRESRERVPELEFRRE